MTQRVAALQMVSSGDIHQNLESAARLIESAASQGAELVLLPENFAVLDGGPLRHMEELYNLAKDPEESRNLVADAASQAKLADMRNALKSLLERSTGGNDTMPIDQGIKIELPEESIR